MTIYNNGGFSAKTERDMVMLISIINTETDIFPSPRMMSDTYFDENLDEWHQWNLEVSDIFGYLDDDLDTIAKKVTEAGINATFDIEYYGDEKGRHVFKDGVFTTYNEEECIIRDADDKTILEEAARRNLIPKEKDFSDTLHDELWEVTGIDENEGLTFAHCTSEELAKAALETIVNADTGFDRDMLMVKKSNLRLNQIVTDGVEINLDNMEKRKTYPIVGLQYSPDDYLTKAGMLRLMSMLNSDKFVTWDIDGNNATATFLIAEDVADEMSVLDMDEFGKYVESILNDINKETKTGEYVLGENSERKFWLGYL